MADGWRLCKRAGLGWRLGIPGGGESRAAHRIQPNQRLDLVMLFEGGIVSLLLVQSPNNNAVWCCFNIADCCIFFTKRRILVFSVSD
jgi:hypothetical protein